MATFQLGGKTVRRVLSRRKESGTSMSGLLKTRANKGTMDGRPGEEAAKLAKRSERGHPNMPMGSTYVSISLRSSPKSPVPQPVTTTSLQSPLLLKVTTLGEACLKDVNLLLSLLDTYYTHTHTHTHPSGIGPSETP